VELQRKKITTLENVIYNNDAVVAQLDSIIATTRAISNANMQKFLQAETEINHQKKLARKYKWQRNLTWISIGLAAASYVFIKVN